MSTRTTASDPAVALYDSVTGLAFFDSADEAEDFLAWTAEHDERDLRRLSNAALAELRRRWRDSRSDTPTETRVPYANSFADTAAGPGSN
jgi:hypothetical protein